MLPDISLSIINTNNREIVLQSLRSLFSTVGDLNLEVFVVNNGCDDGSSTEISKHYPQVNLIENPEILGFSTNNNQVFNRAKGRYLMLLNDDTIVQPGAFQVMVDFMDTHPDVGIVGANLFNLDGTWQVCYEREPNPWYEGFKPLSSWLFPVHQTFASPLQVAAVYGACLMVRNSATKEVGFLDTNFDPLYSEEVDWCFRFRKAGWPVYHLPEAHVIHIGSSTMKNFSAKRYSLIFEKKALFFRKHFTPKTVRIYKITLFLSNLLKTVVWFILYLFAKKERSRVYERLSSYWGLTRRIPSL